MRAIRQPWAWLLAISAVLSRGTSVCVGFTSALYVPPQVVFFWMVEVAVVNSYILHKRTLVYWPACMQTMNYLSTICIESKVSLEVKIPACMKTV